jgi:hypothetical protein
MIKLLGSAAAATAVAACSAPPPEAAPAPAATAAAQPTAAPKAAAASKEMVMWGLKYDPHITRYKALIKAFGDKTGVQTNLQPQDWPLEVKTAAAMSAGTTPDVCCMMGKVLPPLLVRKAVVDVTDLVYKAVGTDITKDWYGDGIPCYTYDGKQYGVPTEFSTISLAGAWPTEDLKYNKITKEEAAKYPPKNGKVQFESYDQMWELAKKLQVEEGGKVIRYGLSSAGWEFSYVSSMLHQMGRKWWNPDNQKFDFNNDDMIKVLQLLVEKPVALGIEVDQGDTQTNLAQQQKVAVARGNVAVIFFLKSVGLWYECFTPPDADPTKPSKWMGEGGWGFVTFPKVKNADNGIEFLKWMATYDGQMTWMKNFVEVYMTPMPFKKCNDDPMWNDTDDKYLNNIRHMYKSQFPMLDKQTFFGGSYGYTSPVESAAGAVCAEIRQKKMTAADGAKTMQDRCQNAYNQWKMDNLLS